MILSVFYKKFYLILLNYKKVYKEISFSLIFLILKTEEFKDRCV